MGSCGGREGAAAHQQVALGLLVCVGACHVGSPVGRTERNWRSRAEGMVADRQLRRANSRGRSGAEGDGEEQEHVPRGEQLAGENAG